MTSPATPPAAPQGSFQEHVLRFGQWNTLAGVVTEPVTPTDGEAAPPDVLFLNSGLLHHVGPHRLHVQLARALAPHGVRSLRFDVSGIGDSGLRRDRMGRDDAMVAETREAMDQLAAAHGSQRFVLFGICTGADQAVRTALADPRVVGAVLVDGYAYTTAGHYLHYYAGRFFSPRSWWNVLSLQHPGYARLLARLRHQRPAPTDTPEERVVPRPGIYARPPREEAEQRLRTLVGRDCELCFVFTPSTRYSHAGQFQTMFPSIGDDARVQVEFLESANHVFTLLASQDALRGAVERWMGARFLGSPVGAPHA